MLIKTPSPVPLRPPQTLQTGLGSKPSLRGERPAATHPPVSLLRPFGRDRTLKLWRNEREPCDIGNPPYSSGPAAAAEGRLRISS